MSTRTAARGNTLLPLQLIATFGIVSVLVWVAVAVGGLISGQGLVGNPVTILLGLATGTVPWPGPWSWVVLAIELTVATIAGWWLLRTLRRRRSGRTRVDPGARHLGRPGDLTAYTLEGVAESARRLRPSGVGDDPDEHGVLIGRMLPSRQQFRSSWEDTIVDIWGPRTGKTTSRAVPAIIGAPGAVLATSNKRDLHDATRGVREKSGDVWLFDPQDIVGDPPTMWFDVLTTVTGPRQAAELVSHFVAGSTEPGAKRDAYFDTEGENLLSYFFLAAARAGEPITAAYEWAANSRSYEPVEILQQSGDRLIASKLQSMVELPEKQREGVWASALRLLRCLEDPAVLRWVTPPASWPEYRDNPDAAETIPRFDPAAFLTTKDTLYLLSKEGEGSASPLVAALTFAVLTAGEDLGRTLHGARLDPPLLCVLDEAANVCRIRQLPNLYSHFGSRGMLVTTILQSWEQGVEVWGKSGMQKLWDSANVRVYGGGSADANFLGSLAALCGEHDELVWSSTYDRSGNTSRNASIRRQKVFDVSDLAAMPRGRVLVFASGAPPVLVEPVPWMASDRAADVQASLARYANNGGTPDAG